MSDSDSEEAQLYQYERRSPSRRGGSLCPTKINVNLEFIFCDCVERIIIGIWSQAVRMFGENLNFVLGRK